MLLFGHIGITLFIASLFFLPVLGAVVGVLLPDIIDKGMFVLGIWPCSRFIAHTVFFFPVAGLVTYAITRNKKLAIAVALGALLHISQDVHDFVPFFYPVVQYDFAALCPTTIQIVFTPYVIATETIGLVLLIFVLGFNDKFVQVRRLFWKLLGRKHD